MAAAQPADDSFVQELADARSVLRTTFTAGKTRSYEWRYNQLQALVNAIRDDSQPLFEALAADLNRHHFESTIEMSSIVAETEHAMSQLKKWMAPEHVSTPLILQPSTSRIDKTPKGVVLVIAPWNFPFNLALLPMMQAIAAGNCVLIKPSELASASADALKQFCEKHMDKCAVRVLLGGPTETTEILARQWDHIFYTGNGTVGRIVMTAAAKHLTPVTLELGGKSPAFIDAGLSDTMLRHAAERLIWGSYFVNAGQICVSPDWCMVIESEEKRIVEALKAAMRKMFPEGSTSSDTSRIINERHFDRVKRLAETSGGETFTLSVAEDRTKCFYPPTLILRPDTSSPIMQEEIFGPLLSVIPVKDIDEACAYVNVRESPLALYIFTTQQEHAEKIIASTTSGGVCINDTLAHIGTPYLPFGGVGGSGFGAYHSKAGFDEFSHKRSVMQKRLFVQVPFIYPPYNEQKADLVHRLQVGPMLKPGEKRMAWAAALATVAGLGGIVAKSCL